MVLDGSSLVYIVANMIELELIQLNLSVVALITGNPYIYICVSIDILQRNDIFCWNRIVYTRKYATNNCIKSGTINCAMKTAVSLQLLD